MKNICFLVFALFTTQFSQNYWQQTNGPYGYEGAMINDFLLYKDSIIFIATPKGIIKSTDNGETWLRKNSSIINCLAVDKFNVLYAGENYLSNNYYLLKSTDDGNTWDRMNLNIWPDIRQILIPYRDTIFLATWNNGICRSTDQGNSWIQTNNGIQYTRINKIIQLSNNQLLSGSDGGGVYKSSNLGDLWMQSSSGIPPLPSTGYIYVNSFCEINSGKILIGSQDGIYYSTNFGDSWIKRSSGYSNGRPNCIIKDYSGNIYAGASISGGVYWSSNAGNNWNYIGLGNSIRTLGFDTESRLCAGALSEGLYRLNNNWELIYRGDYLILETEILSNTKTANILAGTIDGGLYVTTNQGQTWDRTNYYGGEINSIISINDSIIICGDNSKLYISYDCGITWSTRIGNVSALSYDSVNSEVYWTRDNRIYVSNDLGQNWTLLASFSGPPYVYIVTLHVTNLNQYIFVVVSYADQFGSWFGFHRSKDHAQTWTSMNVPKWIYSIEENNLGTIYALGAAGGGLFVTYDEGDNWISKTASGLCLFSDVFNTLYLGTGDGIYYSYDEGDNWIRMDGSGLHDTKINDIIVNNNKIFVATRKGVHLSQGLVPVELNSFTAKTNGNEITLSWSTATELNNQGFEVQRKFGRSDFVTIGSVNGHGTTTSPNNYTHNDKLINAGKYFYRLKQIDYNGHFSYSQAVEVDVRMSNNYSLEQNYPNPFNPSTKIGWQSPVNSYQTIEVFDVLGNEIATLVDEYKPAGSYEVEFNAEKLSSGIYYYQLRADSFVETKKMILMR